MAAEIRIGISGWRYAGWRGPFYPKGLPQRRELDYASRRLNAIEINGTFYGLQRPASFRAWRAATPEGFVFALKGSRYITHFLKLAAVETPLANFFASGLLALGPKLGPILWQLPPWLRFEPERIERFLALLPRSADGAAALARRHDKRLAGRAWLEVEEPDRPLRHALEVRHESFRTPAFIALLRRQRVALCVADGAGLPFFEDATADLVYCRLHGTEYRYWSGYEPPAIEAWAERVHAWRAGGQRAGAVLAAPDDPPPRRRRDVYVFFDNDAKVRAPFDAIALAERLGLRPAEAAEADRMAAAAA